VAWNTEERGWKDDGTGGGVQTLLAKDGGKSGTRDFGWTSGSAEARKKMGGQGAGGD